MSTTAPPSQPATAQGFPYQQHHEFDVSSFREELFQLAKQLGPDVQLTDRTLAEHLDVQDPLNAMRQNYHIPTLGDICDPALLSKADSSASPSDEALYMCGNSLGPLPKLSEKYVGEELDAWKRKAVIGHFSHPYSRPWTSAHLGVSEMCADLIGAKPSEVTVMGTLTGNLHSLLATFYRPAVKPFGVGFNGDVDEARKRGDKVRHKILYEFKAFPSDRYALASAIELNGFDVETSLITLKPKEGRKTLDEQDILDTLDALGREGETALVLLGGVQYFTGQFFPIEKMVKLAHSHGILFGVDLAHAFANVPLRMHDWGVDMACFCTYKYGQSGPGGMGGLFVHEKWTDDVEIELTRPAGWYGHERKTRFSMPEHFKPERGAGGWQVSNGSALDLASLRGSLETLFKVKELVQLPKSTSASTAEGAEKGEVGYGSVMPILRARSLRLTSYLEMLLTSPGFLPDSVDVKLVTPSNPAQRGSQLCIQFPEVNDDTTTAPTPAPAQQGTNGNGNDVPPPIDDKKLIARAHARVEKSRGLVADIRHPDILRLAPLAQYSTFVDVFRSAEALRISIEEIKAGTKLTSMRR